jgi:adenylylsulfate kinase
MTHGSGLVCWFTGLSGAGKTTVARALYRRCGGRARWWDGDVARRTFSRGLGFSAQDRSRQVRALAQRAKGAACAGRLALVSAVSPARVDRRRARQVIGARRWREIHLATPQSTCESREPKGLYRRARSGELHGVCGVDARYEPPQRPALRLDAARCSRAACLALTLRLLARERAA